MRVDAAVARHLGVKGRRQHAPLPHGHRVPSGAGQHLDGLTDPLDPRSPDEHGVHGGVQPYERDVRLERVHLPAKGIAPHGHVDPTERQRLPSRDPRIQDLAGQQDHPRARPVGRHPVGQPCAQRFEQFQFAQQVAHRRGLATGDYQRVDGFQLGKPPNRA